MAYWPTWRKAVPKFLEAKLKKEYPSNPAAVYGTMNSIGAMRGSKITPKGEEMEKKHENLLKSGRTAKVKK